MRTSLAWPLLVAAGIVFPMFAVAEEPSTAAERTRAVGWAKELETHPLADGAADKRRVLVEWAEHGMGRIRLRYDDRRELSQSVVAHDLKTVRARE